MFDLREPDELKPDLTRAWYDSDQIGYNWTDRRNDDVNANSGKGLNFLDFDTLSRQRSSPHMQQEQQQAVPLPILNENKFNTWSTNPTNPFPSTWCADDATREIKTTVNPFKACVMGVNNKSGYDRSVRNQDFTAVTPVSGNIMFEFRVPKGPINLFKLEKQMVKLFGWQPASQTDAVAEFYYRKQLPGEDYRDFYTKLRNLAKYAYAYTGEFDQRLNEPFMFWRVDAAKPQTCAEAYNLEGQSYARLEILKRNKSAIEQRSVDQTEFRTEQSFIPNRTSQYDTNNKPTLEMKRLCHFCYKSEHVIADCYARIK
ncbi:unnamed protein product [Brachionus calyciflorus]|uniref:Uncharacterized protein n=1 Tax=Brachionus calyciflorus TaxID=104777 RepID=A0A814FSY6_9BILA|nr:unnamed protein product [Brachionus calyciflorus]